MIFYYKVSLSNEYIFRSGIFRVSVYAGLQEASKISVLLYL